VIDLLGDIGGVLFGIACVPMAYTAWKKGSTKGIPTSSMWLFLWACALYYGWLFLRFGFHLPFVIGIVEVGCWLIVLKYRYFPREEKMLLKGSTGRKEMPPRPSAKPIPTTPRNNDTVVIFRRREK